jgi:hypothetical protein
MTAALVSQFPHHLRLNDTLDGTRVIRRLLFSDPAPPARGRLGVPDLLAAFVTFLTPSDPNAPADESLQVEAALVLSNIALSPEARSIVEAGALPALVALLLTSHADARYRFLSFPGYHVRERLLPLR